MQRRCLSCFTAAAMALCVACGGGTTGARNSPSTTVTKAPAASSRRSVILISVDTLRADHVGVRGLTPALDAFAKHAVRYTAAWSHAPLTLPAHASMLTGLLPTRHGVRDNVGYELRAGETLAERFKKAGYATGGFVSSTVLRRETGIGRGFDAFDDEMTSVNGKPGPERTGAATVSRALGFVDAHKAEPFLLFVHLYDPHVPYAADARFATRGVTAYDHDVAQADDAVGALLDGLKARGVSNPVIAVTSDHGEGLGDHGEDEHGLLLYAEALRVPLLISGGDDAKTGTEVASTVRQVDIAPTVLKLVGLPAENMDGASLQDGAGNASRPVYSETWYPRIHFGWSELASAAEGKWHFIGGPKPELYDLDADPAERKNLGTEPGRPAAAMARFIDDQRKGATESRGATSAEAEEQLRSLGYLGSRGFSSSASGANPRDKVAFYRPFMEAFTGALSAHEAGDFARASVAYKKAIALVRGEKGLVVPKLHSGLADSLARLGQTAEAEKEFRAELALDGNSVEARTGLGTLYWTQSRDAAAREVIGGIVTRNAKAGASEYASVVRAFEILGDTESVQSWRARAQAAGYLK